MKKDLVVRHNTLDNALQSKLANQRGVLPPKKHPSHMVHHTSPPPPPDRKAKQNVGRLGGEHKRPERVFQTHMSTIQRGIRRLGTQTL